MTSTNKPLPRSEQEIFEAGYADGQQDVMTPAIRRRLVAAGLPAYLARIVTAEPQNPAPQSAAEHQTHTGSGPAPG